MLRATAPPHVMPALLASTKIRRAKATARCAWQDRGPTRARVQVRARALHAQQAATRRNRPLGRALHAAQARSLTKAPVVAPRYVLHVQWGSTQWHQTWRHARTAQQGDTSARRARLLRATVQHARRARSQIPALSQEGVNALPVRPAGIRICQMLMNVPTVAVGSIRAHRGRLCA